MEQARRKVTPVWPDESSHKFLAPLHGNPLPDSGIRGNTWRTISFLDGVVVDPPHQSDGRANGPWSLVRRLTSSMNGMFHAIETLRQDSFEPLTRRHDPHFSCEPVGSSYADRRTSVGPATTKSG